MTPLGVHHVSINVDDVEAARRFYVDILGLTERTDRPAFCFQGHPEASPGPHDIAVLFDRFINLMQAAKESSSHA